MRQSEKALAWGQRFFFGVGWILISLLALNYHQSLIFPSSFAGWAYYLLAFFGHYGSLLAAVYFLLYWPVAKFSPSRRLPRLWGTFLMTLACAMLFLDSMIFAQYRFHLNGFVLNMIFGGAFKDIFQFPLISYVMAFGAIALLVAVLWIFGGKLWKNIERRPRPRARIFAAIFLAALSGHILHAYSNAKGIQDVTAVANLLPLNFPLTANKFFKKMGVIPEQQTRFISQEDTAVDFHYPESAMDCPSEEQKNILFIVIDSWRHDEMNQEVTPFLDKYKNEGLAFKSHFAGSHNTRAGIFSLFYGLPAIYWKHALNSQTPPVFMDELRKRQYELGIFASASLVSPEFDRTVFSNVPNLRISTEGSNSVEKDLRITKEWKEWLAARKNPQGPFFGFLFYDTPHSYIYPKDFERKFEPLAPSKNYLTLNNFTDPEPIFNLHRMSVAFVDTLIEEVITDLKERGLADNTVVVITGDHGEEMNDNKRNYWGHYGNYSPPQTQVPLIIVWPGADMSLADHAPTSHYDIVPTLMNGLWQCQNPVESYSFGSSFFDYHPKDWLIVGSYLDTGVLDFKNEHIMLVNQMGHYSVTDFKMAPLKNEKANEALFLQVMRELTRFKVRP